MLQNIKSRIKDFFNQLFCRHHCSFVGTHPYFYYEDTARTKRYDCPVDFFECEYCHKRKFVADAEPAVYKNQVWQELKMWEKHELEMNFSIPKKEIQD